MGLDINNRNTYYFVDEYGLMLVQNGDNGKGDCIGRTLYSYITYNHEPFIVAVKNCFIVKYDKNNKMYFQGYRHPSYIINDYNDMSRDHILNTLILMKLADESFLKELSEKLKWKISDRHTFTPDLWLWMKGIAGNKFAMFLYYLINIPMIFFSIIWNKIVYKWAGVTKEVPQDDFIITPNNQKSEKIKKCGKLVLPMYTIAQLSFMLYVAPKSIGKWLLKKICLFGVDKQNFLLRIMFGGKVNENDIYTYKPMTGWRWSGYLNNLNDRDMRIITNPELTVSNVLDFDLLRKIYENQ